MAIKGQRFQINLSSDEEADAPKTPRPISTTGPALGLVGDIKERTWVLDAKPPSPPTISHAAATGFPAHGKRRKQFAFKPSRAGPGVNGRERSSFALPTADDQGARAGKDEVGQSSTEKEIGMGRNAEAQRIDEENKRRIANMTPEAIEEARRELLTGLSSSLIERLLRNANIDDDALHLIDEPEPDHPTKKESSHPGTRSTKAASDLSDPTPNTTTPLSQNTLSAMETSLARSDLPPSQPPSDLHPASMAPPPLSPQNRQDSSNLPPPPPLDPTSPSFLSDLHATYFPSFPTNPAALAWMSPLPPSSQSSSSSQPQSANDNDYSPFRPSLPPNSFRFDFRGHLLPPRLAAQIPITKGLHHHSVAPDAAGYTIPELVRLAHSAVAAQRCIAYQTLGRLLYRLGRGDFGSEGEDLCEGLWASMEQGQVLDFLVREAARGGEEGEGGNRTCWVTATEAVWLWRRGGGKRWKAE